MSTDLDRPTLAQLARQAMQACEQPSEVRIPPHDPRLIRDIRLRTGLNELQFAEILGIPPERVNRLEQGLSRTDRHENHMLDVIRRRCADKAREAPRVYFLKLHEVAVRQGPAMATVVLALGVELK